MSAGCPTFAPTLRQAFIPFGTEVLAQVGPLPRPSNINVMRVIGVHTDGDVEFSDRPESSRSIRDSVRSEKLMLDSLRASEGDNR